MSGCCAGFSLDLRHFVVMYVSISSFLCIIFIRLHTLSHKKNFFLMAHFLENFNFFPCMTLLHWNIFAAFPLHAICVYTHTYYEDISSILSYKLLHPACLQWSTRISKMAPKRKMSQVLTKIASVLGIPVGRL